MNENKNERRKLLFACTIISIHIHARAHARDSSKRKCIVAKAEFSLNLSARKINLYILHTAPNSLPTLFFQISLNFVLTSMQSFIFMWINFTTFVSINIFRTRNVKQMRRSIERCELLLKARNRETKTWIEQSVHFNAFTLESVAINVWNEINWMN